MQHAAASGQTQAPQQQPQLDNLERTLRRAIGDVANHGRVSLQELQRQVRAIEAAVDAFRRWQGECYERVENLSRRARDACNALERQVGELQARVQQLEQQPQRDQRNEQWGGRSRWPQVPERRVQEQQQAAQRGGDRWHAPGWQNYNRRPQQPAVQQEATEDPAAQPAAQHQPAGESAAHPAAEEPAEELADERLPAGESAAQATAEEPAEELADERLQAGESAAQATAEEPADAHLPAGESAAQPTAEEAAEELAGEGDWQDILLHLVKLMPKCFTLCVFLG